MTLTDMRAKAMRISNSNSKYVYEYAMIDENVLFCLFVGSSLELLQVLFCRRGIENPTAIARNPKFGCSTIHNFDWSMGSLSYQIRFEGKLFFFFATAKGPTSSAEMTHIRGGCLCL